MPNTFFASFAITPLLQPTSPKPLPSSRECTAIHKELSLSATAPATTLDEPDDPLQITPATLRSIHALQTSTQDACDNISNADIKLLILALQSEVITDAKCALGSFSHRKLKTLNTWPK
jgi:hypothetical protein